MTEPTTIEMPHLGYCPDCEYLGDQRPVAAPQAERSRARLTSALVATVVFLTAIAPLATDMYVPAFPQVAADLSATATQVQLTLTTFFVGMALGQLIGGPVSDQRGRRGLLIAAVAVMALASVVCALAPTITVMMAARFVQGFAGGWAMVIGRAVIVDLATRRPTRPGAERDRRRRRHRPHRRTPDRSGDPATVALAGLVLDRRRPRRGDDHRRADRRAGDPAPPAAAQRRAADLRHRGP